MLIIPSSPLTQEKGGLLLGAALPRPAREEQMVHQKEPGESWFSLSTQPPPPSAES